VKVINSLTFVIDTSVAVKWLNPEKEQDLPQAEKLLELLLSEKAKAFVPDLIVYEISNALIKGKGATSEQLSEYLDRFLTLPLIFSPYSIDLLKQTGIIAEKYGITFYDASFFHCSCKRE
jgi:predicted nucleic acid-binding protein